MTLKRGEKKRFNKVYFLGLEELHYKFKIKLLLKREYY